MSGFKKTTEWTLTAYDRRKTANDFSCTVNAGGVFSADTGLSLEDSTHDSPRHRTGPKDAVVASPPDSPLAGQGSPLPLNQCVFLQYYKCRPRVLGLTTLRKPQNLKPKDMLDRVSDEYFCGPLDALVSGARNTFGRRKDIISLYEQPQERVSSSSHANSRAHSSLVDGGTRQRALGLYLKGECIFSVHHKRICLTMASPRHRT